MKARHPLDSHRLTRCLIGEPAPEDQAAFERWTQEEPENEHLVSGLREMVALVKDRPASPISVEAIRASLAAHVATSLPAEAEQSARVLRLPPLPVRKSRAITYTLGVVATLLVIMSAPRIWDIMNRGPLGATTREYVTNEAQRAEFQLPDGSNVMLAPGSRIRYSSGQGRGREVALDGQALFTVASQGDQPFTVATGNASIRVLGTTFMVRRYPTDHHSQVVVEDGKVAIRPLHRLASPDAQSVLTANMLATVEDSSVVVTSGVTVDNYIGWVHGRLVFNRVPLGDVATELSRVYGVSIRIADSSLAKQTMMLKATVDTQPITEVLELIGRAVNAHYRRTGTGFVLIPGRLVTPGSTKQVPSQPERRYGK